MLRAKRLTPLGDLIEQTFAKFRDHQDSGLLTLTHIYLLVGTSLPIWLTSPVRPTSSANMLAMTSGVITVGIGDTAAAVGGSLWGRHRWKGSNKTYEGTVCALVAQFGATWLLIRYLSLDIAFDSFHVLITIAISATTAVIEAKLSDIDNLVLPIYHYILVKLIFK